MKRLGVFVSILMLAIGLFGGFLSPEKGYAAFEAAQAETLQTFSNVSFTDKYSSEQKQVYSTYYAELGNILKQRASTMDPKKYTDKPYIINSLNDFIKYLEDKKDGANPDIQTVLKDTLDHANTFHTEVSLRDINQASTFAAGGGLTTENTTQYKETVNAELKTTQKQGATRTEKCAISFSSGETFSLSACISEGFTWFIKKILLNIAAWLFWATTNLFNYSVQIGILGFKDWAPDSLYPIWVIVRQIISLIIVFVGLYLGFMYILGKEDKFEKYIPWVIVFGLFVNFSYPITRTAIDLSNIVSLNIYASAVGDDAITGTNMSLRNPRKTVGSIVLARIGLQGLIAGAVDDKKISSTGNTLLDRVDSIPAALAVVAFVLYAAYIFFMATAIMLVRTLGLVFITVLSPLLLVDSVLPILGKKAQELRGLFFNQLIVGPVFMIMLALTLKFLDVFSSNAKGVGLDGVGGGTADGSIATFFNLLLMLGMLHITITVTKKFSGELGTWATNALGSVGGVGLGMATGGLGFVGRQGIGRLASHAQNKGWVSSDPNSLSGRMTSRLANGSFDLRNSSVVAGGMGKLGFNKGVLGMGGMGQGSASKTSFIATSDAKAKKIEASAAARFKTKHERDVFDKDGNLVAKKGDINKEQLEAKQKFMEEKSKSIFLSKDAKNKMVDEESEALYTNKLKEHTDLKTDAEKNLNLKNLEEELQKAKESDPKFETAKSRALAKTIADIKKKRGEEDDAFGKEFEKNLSIYQATSEEKRAVYLAQQSREMQESLKAGKNLRSEQVTSTASTETSQTASTTTSSRVEDTNWELLDTPAVTRRGDQQNVANSSPNSVTSNLAARRAARLKKAMETVDAKITSETPSNVTK